MVSTIDRAALGRQRVTPRFRDSWVLPIAQTTCFCVVPFEWIIDLCTRVLMIAQSFWIEGPLQAALARLDHINLLFAARTRSPCAFPGEAAVSSLASSPCLSRVAPG